MNAIVTSLNSLACLMVVFFNDVNAATAFKPNYAEALKLSLLFYEAQRSGYLPESNRIPWRNHSATTDRGSNGEDLVGGYYDASDFVKFSFTMAYTSTILAWGMLSYGDAYKRTGEFQHGLDAIKWAADYFVKSHVSPNEFYGQVGDFSLDHQFWGRPEDMNMTRPAYKINETHPGSDLAGEASAALSSASMVFQPIDATYSELLLKHAKELFDFASDYRGLYHEAIPGAKSYYESTGYGDELTWAATWLYKATRDVSYAEKAESFYMQFRLAERPNEFFYNKIVAGIQVLLAQETQRDNYKKAVKSFCDFSVYEQKRTPLGLLYIEKTGTLSHAANVAFVCLQAVSLDVGKPQYLAFAREQIDYILGSKGRSFVVGYGKNFPKQPHHSASSCPDAPEPCDWKQFSSKKPNPQILYGALVSGPDEIDHYEDRREEFLYNEVTLDYNAGFQSTLAGLIHYQNTNKTGS